MRYFGLILALLFPWPLTAGEAKPPTPEQAYELVKTARAYSIGGVGAAGAISTSEQAFRVLLAQPDAAGQFEKLLKEGTPAGQLYALMGAKDKNDPAYQAALKKLEASKKKVTVAEGCEVFESTVGEVAKQIGERK